MVTMMCGHPDMCVGHCVWGLSVTLMCVCVCVWGGGGAVCHPNVCVGTICHPDVCVWGGGGGGGGLSVTLMCVWGLSVTLMCVGLSLTMMCVCVGGLYLTLRLSKAIRYIS